MKGIKALQSHFTSLLENLKDNAQVATFKRTFTQDMDLLEKQLTKGMLHEIDCKTALTFSEQYTIIGDMDLIKKYMIETILHQQEIQQLLNEKKLQTQEVQSNTVQELKVDLVVMEITCSRKENSNLETALSKSVKESSSNSETKDVQQSNTRLELKLNNSETHYFNTWVMLRSLLLKEHVIKDIMIEGSGNDTDADDADIRPIYDEEPMAKV
ncbi:hypothetical protein Tco_1576942 [Tanacetum coccineum]